MNARVFMILSVYALLTNCVTVNLHKQSPEIITIGGALLDSIKRDHSNQPIILHRAGNTIFSTPDGRTLFYQGKSKVELTPILITGGLNDIAVISAPILNAQAVYYLHKPNGDALQLNFNNDKAEEKFTTNNIRTDSQFTIFNVNHNDSDATEAVTAQAKMAPHDFTIGPLQEEDHGNWVFSAYFKDIDGHWIEMFQVITLEIIETVPLSPGKSQLNTGDAYVVSFAYPIPDLQSCQIEPPESTIDRFYDRPKITADTCEYVMKNITSSDEGIWTIIGVGRIVYKGTAYLHIQNT